MDDKRQEIERKAYELYEKSGCVSGRDMDHWLEAEKIVHSRHAATTSFKAKKGSSAKTATKTVVRKSSMKSAADSKKAKTSSAKKR